MRTSRLETLTDGIFAIAMTLLILNLALPEVADGVKKTQLHNLLLGQWEIFINYAVSFLVLAFFWLRHHRQFHVIKRTDRIHLSINILFLMFVALVPFSTSLMGDYPHDRAAVSFFAANIFILGMLSLLSWVYATRGHRLVDHSLTPQRIARGIEMEAVMPLVSAMLVILSLIDPAACFYAFLVIPVLLLISAYRYRKMPKDTI